MPIKGIVFDFGGVILRTEDRQPRMSLAEKQGVSIEALEHLVFSSQSAKMAEVGSISAFRHWQEVARTLQVSEEEIPTLRQQFFAGDRMNWDLVAYIRSLRRDYRTALLSNAFDDLREELSGAWRIPDAFDEVIISAEEGFAKPDRRIFQCVADRLRVTIDECALIDDFPPNVEGARLAGMKAIRFINTDQARFDLETILNGNSL